jgi:hypothetical protein
VRLQVVSLATEKVHDKTEDVKEKDSREDALALNLSIKGQSLLLACQNIVAAEEPVPLIL